jgi:hypothetical protein
MSTAEYQRQWRAKHSTGRPSGRAVVAECGTTSEYKRHRRLGEPVDAACREAWNMWQRDYYQKRKGKRK